MLESGESERAIAALKIMLEQYAEHGIRYNIHLTIGRHLLNAGNSDNALEHLHQALDIDDTVEDMTELEGEAREVFLESQYLIGVANFHASNYDQCFSSLRVITADFPNTVWANQAYYYIGMSHFVQRNWSKAIRYLSLVGTSVDTDSEAASLVEAGRRMFIKINDTDLPIESRLNRPSAVEIRSAKSGDRERTGFAELSRQQGAYIASLPTVLGPAQPGDGIIQVIGGDSLQIVYLDRNTSDGTSKVPRQQVVQVVGSATVAMRDATYEQLIDQAYIGQPVFLELNDADLDSGPDQQTAIVRVVTEYLQEEAETDTLDFLSIGGAADQGPRWEVRDEVQLSMAEVESVLEEPSRTGHLPHRSVP